jgi:hypothetical protein
MEFKQLKSLLKSQPYCSIATVNQNGQPHNTPIGSVFLENESKGYYLEMYTRSIAANAKENNKACIMVVNASIWYWLKSLFKGKFVSPLGARIYVELKEKRIGTDLEKNRFLKKVKPLKFTKGYKKLWGANQFHVRDFVITDIKPVAIKTMS